MRDYWRRIPEMLACLNSLFGKMYFWEDHISGTEIQKLQFLELKGKNVNRKLLYSKGMIQQMSYSTLKFIDHKHAVVNSGFFTLSTEPSQGSVGAIKLPLINFVSQVHKCKLIFFCVFIRHNLNKSLDIKTHWYSIDKLNPKITNMGYVSEVVESNMFWLLMDSYSEI